MITRPCVHGAEAYRTNVSCSFPFGTRSRLEDASDFTLIADTLHPIGPPVRATSRSPPRLQHLRPNCGTMSDFEPLERFNGGPWPRRPSGSELPEAKPRIEHANGIRLDVRYQSGGIGNTITDCVAFGASLCESPSGR